MEHDTKTEAEAPAEETAEGTLRINGEDIVLSVGQTVDDVRHDLAATVDAILDGGQFRHWMEDAGLDPGGEPAAGARGGGSQPGAQSASGSGTGGGAGRGNAAPGGAAGTPAGSGGGAAGGERPRPGGAGANADRSSVEISVKVVAPENSGTSRPRGRRRNRRKNDASS